MTGWRKGKGVSPKQREAFRYHSKSPKANPETLRRLAGVIKLSGPVPSKRFFDRDDPYRSAESARD